MIKTTVNTFIGGMSKDLDKGLLPRDKYLDASNYRLITTEGSTTGSLENIKGNSSIIDGAGVTTLVTGSIIGSCQLRDYIILFTTDNTSTTPTARGNRIYKIGIDLVTEKQTSFTRLYDDTYNVDDSSLNFSTAYPIKAIGKYETPNVQKVYWTDGYNNIRYINVAAHQTVDAEAYVADGDYMSIDKFEFLPKFIVSKPTLKDIVGGKLKSGMIAYAYQLYMINGAETAFSPLSDPIHVVTDSDSLKNTSIYHGDAVSSDTGKGFVIQIDNTLNVGYNRLRMVRIQYDVLNSLPEITITNEIEISNLGEIVTVTDVGDSLGELTIDEFNISSTELFKCQDIATKENKLFVANITKSDFEVDTWDARAVRFKSDTTATVYNGVTPTVILGNLSNWSDYTATHDGINKFNDPTNDGNAAYQWMYQANGTTLGAEGLNIKIDFESEAVTVDNSPSATSFYATSPSSGTDKSYTNFASPWKGGQLSWQRDEVYRLFVVFGNDRGQVDAPKWICDLRMPSLHDADFTNSSSVTVKPSTLLLAGVTHRLYPRIYFKSFPANATYAQIYRIKRERSDRSVVTQGLVVPTSLSGGVYYPKQVSGFALPNNGEMFKLVSPEININKNIAKQANDYIEYVTNYNGVQITDVKSPSSTSYLFGHIVKLHTNVRVPFATATVAAVDDALMVSPAITNQEIVTIDTKQFNNYDITSSIKARGCSGLVIAYSPATWSAETVLYPIVNYKSNVYGSQYGGNTYEDRMANISIPCSGVIRSTNTSTWIDIPYGDTFINYFDVSTLLADLNEDVYQDTWSETVFVALESSINCDLRHDVEGAKNYPIPTNYQEYTPYFRQEYAGTHTMSVHGTDREFLQSKNLYLYNTVYSQQMEVKAVISLVVDKILETEFDSMIKVSNNKSNGEITDSWTKFGINDFIEVDSIYGPVNALKNFNDKLFYFQDKAFGLLAINDRSLITDSNSAQLVLGTGGVLDRYDYISTILGCKDKFGLSNGTTGLFWYDRTNNFIIKFSDRLDKVSLSKGIQSYLNANVLSTQEVISHPDINNNEVLFTFFVGGTGSTATAFTIAYSENIDAFTSFYTFIPNIYIPYNNRYLTTTRAKYCNNQFTLTNLFLHDSDIYPRCNFYAPTNNNATYYADSTLKVLFNEDYLYTKTWDNISYMSNVYYNGVELYNQTLDDVRCYNDYQNTDYVNLTYATNLRRRERSWTLDIPRNLVDVNTTSDPDIFAAGSLTNTTRTFRERLRDKYMIADFTFVNGLTRDKFVLSNLAAKYRISYR